VRGWRERAAATGRRLGNALCATRLSLELLLGRRLLLFAAIDVLVVGSQVVARLLDSGGEPRDLYAPLILLPFLALGLPALAGVVDLERRAGCLDLALAAPSAEAYFVRRAAAVCGVLAVQGWGLALLDWLVEGRGFPLLAVLVQIAVLALFLGALALFWAVRLKSAGGVWIAAAASAVALGRWLFANPIPDRLHTRWGPLLPGAEAALEQLPSVAVLATAAVLLFLYARRRLRRPESMVG
jgi:hypothetical protein